MSVQNTYDASAAAPRPNAFDTSRDSAPIMTTGDWFVTLLILSIPIVNIIMLLVWGFGSQGNVNRQNYCRASMIWIAIGIGLYACFALFLFAGNS